MCTPEHISAVIELRPTTDGGLVHPLPSGTQSVLVVFGDDPDPRSSRSAIGARIHVFGGGDLRPGASGVEVWLEFYDPAGGATLAAAHSTFWLWYARTVGTGRITGSVSDA